MFQCTERVISCLVARADVAGVTVERQIVRRGYWPAADGTLQRTLVEFVETHKLTNARVVTVLPRHCATVRMLELPSQDLEEVRGMVELSADDLVPYSVDEIVVSSCIVRALPDEQSQVLAAVVHRDVLDEQLALYQGAGIAPESIFLSTACLLAALEYPTAHDDGIGLFGHAGADSVELLATDDGQVLYTRGLEADMSGIEVDTSDTNEISSLIQRAYLDFEREVPKGHATSLRFSAGDDSAVGVMDAVRDSGDLDISENTMGLRGVKKGVESLSGLPLYEIGAVLLTQGDSPYVVDLLPESVKDTRARDRSKRVLLQNALTLLVAVLLIAVAFGQAVYQRNAYLDELEARARDLRPLAATVKLKRQHLQRLQEQVTQQDTVYQHIGRIAAQAPKSRLTFSRFDYRYRSGITLQGRVERLDDFTGLVDQLRTVGRSIYPHFAKVQELYSNSRSERSKAVWDYGIAITFPLEEGGANE